MIRYPRRHLRAEEDRFLSSGQRQCLAFGAETITGYSFGSGPTVLLVHGLLGSSADFQRLIPAIAEAGYRALAIDWTNHGRSPRGPVLSANSIRNLSDLFTEITDLHAVIGHSAGAYFAMLAMAHARQCDRPHKGVFISAPTSITTPMLALMTHLGVPQSLYCEVCRWFERTMQAPIHTWDLTARLPAENEGLRQQELLFVHDPCDPYAPYRAVEQRARSDVRVALVACPQAGHFKLLQEDVAIEAICNFIARPAGAWRAA